MRAVALVHPGVEEGGEGRKKGKKKGGGGKAELVCHFRASPEKKGRKGERGKKKGPETSCALPANFAKSLRWFHCVANGERGKRGKKKECQCFGAQTRGRVWAERD